MSAPEKNLNFVFEPRAQVSGGQYWGIGFDVISRCIIKSRTQHVGRMVVVWYWFSQFQQSYYCFDLGMVAKACCQVAWKQGPVIQSETSSVHHWQCISFTLIHECLRKWIFPWLPNWPDLKILFRKLLLSAWRFKFGSRGFRRADATNGLLRRNQRLKNRSMISLPCNGGQSPLSPTQNFNWGSTVQDTTTRDQPLTYFFVESQSEISPFSFHQLLRSDVHEACATFAHTVTAILFM